jgi:hypothetical protein
LPGDERDVAKDVVQTSKPTVQGKPQGKRGPGVRAPYRRNKFRIPRCAFGEAFVNPVPGKIAERDRLNSHRVGGGKRQWGNVTEHESRTKFTEEDGLPGNGRIEVCVELGRAPNASIFIRTQTVRLNQSRIAFDGSQLDVSVQRPFKQPPGNLRADGNGNVWGELAQRANEFDVARGVTETVAGNIEGEWS